jgi:hypothetical protein
MQLPIDSKGTMMDCHLFRVLVDRIAREQVGGTGLKELALDHACQCAQCGIRLSEAQEVSASLSTLAGADAGEQAPARIEVILLSYVREQKRSRRVRRRERWLAAAAAIVAAAAIGVWSRQHLLPARHNPPARVELAPPAKLRQADGIKPIAPPRVRSRMKATIGQASSALESGFILLPYGQDAPSLSGAQIVRVAVTPAALASMGVPVPDPSVETYFEADVIVGDDGVARAIRLGSYSGQ